MKKLTKLVYLSYGLGEFGAILVLNTFDMYSTYFFTDVLLISVASMGIIFFFGRIIDTGATLLAGFILDKVHFKSSSYCNWIRLSAPLLGVFVVLFFTQLNINKSFYIIYYILLYGFVNFLASLSYTAHLSLNSALSLDGSERLNLSTVRGQTNALGKIVQSALAIPLVLLIGSGNEVQGFWGMIVIMCLCCIICYGFEIFNLKKYEEDHFEKSKCQKITLKQILTQFKENVPLRKIFYAECAKWFQLITMYSMTTYYYKYIIGSMNMVSVFYLVMNLALLAGTFIGKFFARKLPTGRVYFIGLMMLGIFSVLSYFAKSNQILFIGLMAVGNCGFGITNSVSVSIFSDTIVYGEWKTHINLRGITMSLYTFNMKFSYIFSSFFVAVGLSLTGYIANTALSLPTMNAIRLLMTLIPGFIVLIGTFLFRKYDLTNEKVAKMQRELD